ncbi:MAG: enoyl-CoA hydratase/carnithine racemase, partial [Gammaproteobacteria bacterium]
SRAWELLLSGRVFDAQEADRIGLISRVVTDDALTDTVLGVAAEIAANSPFGVWMTKEAMWPDRRRRCCDQSSSDRHTEVASWNSVTDQSPSTTITTTDSATKSSRSCLPMANVGVNSASRCRLHTR